MSSRKGPLVFLSYRRQDASGIARWLGESLSVAFGSQRVFIDVDQIRVGDGWPQRIDQALREASALLVVIGPNWLRIADDFGRRRLDREDDWVRREVTHAIDSGILVLPVLVSQATLPEKEGLPPALVRLVDFEFL